MRSPALRRVANPLSIWIAMLAIVLQSVMPMVAQARMHVRAADASHGVHVAHGMHAEHQADVAPGLHADHQVDAAAAAEVPANPHAMHGDAPCPYCRVHLDTVALPPIPNPHWVLLVSLVHHLIADEAAPVTAEAWSPTWQRGPPLIV